MKISEATHIPLGLSCLIVGAGAIWIASDYSYGTVTAMGPGFVPTLVAGMLSALGVLTLALGGRDVADAPRQDEDSVADGMTDARGAFATLRVMVCVVGAIVLFGLCVKPLGLAVTIFLVVLVAGLAHPEARPAALITLALSLSAAACIGFVMLLGLQIGLWPRLG